MWYLVQPVRLDGAVPKSCRGEVRSDLRWREEGMKRLRHCTVQPHRPTQIAQHVGAPQRGYPVVHQSRVQPPQHVRLPKHHIDGSPLAPSAAPAIPARSYTPVSRTETMFVSAHLKIQT